MNKELLDQTITEIAEKNKHIHVLSPGNLSPEDTATNLVNLLKAIYVEHGISKNTSRVVDSINNGDLLTWFATDENNDFIATASLIRQSPNTWELGRAVSVSRGGGIGKMVLLDALKFHIENHVNMPLVAEVRSADNYKGIPSGIATQKIFFGLINDIATMVPYAIAPLFSHGDPIRNEMFILSSNDLPQGSTITEKYYKIVNGRSFRGVAPSVKIVQREPFQIVTPSTDGTELSNLRDDIEQFSGCTLFPIEATDRNMPLIGKLLSNPNMVMCGIDRCVGNENRPIVLIATLGNINDLAPSKINEAIPIKIREDIQEISNKFVNIYKSNING